MKMAKKSKKEKVNGGNCVIPTYKSLEEIPVTAVGASHPEIEALFNTIPEGQYFRRRDFVKAVKEKIGPETDAKHIGVLVYSFLKRNSKVEKVDNIPGTYHRIA